MRAFNLGQEGRQEHSLGAMGRTSSKRVSPNFGACEAQPGHHSPSRPWPWSHAEVDWQPMAEKWLKDRRVILHSDSAKSYRLKVAGVLHDAVVHQKNAS